MGLTLGSLFDGSGGFPLAGMYAGIEPVWASEIEPYPIRVTHKNIPEMKHLGDVRNIDGSLIEPVDVLTFGSPCQDLSISKNVRQGLSGSKSGLFHEAMRIINEMHQATDGKYPKYVVFENVTGAFSSNRGDDFFDVLKSFLQIKHKGISIPKPEKWRRAGCILADDMSIAWRTFNAKFWGVPQNRERIYLVCDLRGQSAAHILFESESVSGNTQESCKEDERSSGSFKTAIGKTGESLVNPTPPPHYLIENHPSDGRCKLIENDICSCLTARMGTGGNNVPLVMKKPPSKNRQLMRMIRFGEYVESEWGGALMARDCKSPRDLLIDEGIRKLTPLECCRIQGFPDYWTKGLVNENPTEEEVDFWIEVYKAFGKPKTETQIRKWLAKEPCQSDQYKMWGNGIALPCAEFILTRIAEQKDELI